MDTNHKLKAKRHSLAHLLGRAVLKHYPQAKLTLGPAIDNGFYYDIDFSGGDMPGENDLAKLEKTMRKFLPIWTDFDRQIATETEAKSIYKDNPFKLELIDEIVAKGKEITLYTAGKGTEAEFTDLCDGGHTKNPAKEIAPDSFKLAKIAGAYWRGDEKKPMLTRIYGLAFDTKAELKNYQKERAEAAERDHRKIGQTLGLFTFSETVGKGLPLYTAKGSAIRRELERFIVDEEIKRGYLHVCTPDIANLDLYKKSGHYPYYKDSMYPPIDIDGEQFMLRPMTCPHHFELYKNKPHSYRELPMRIGELAKLYRYEQSGELTGLIRVRSFCLADAHIICRDEEQAVSEVGKALDLIEYIADVFKLKLDKDYWYSLSLGDRNDNEKYYQNDEAWEKSEDLLRQHLTNRGCKFVEVPDEAAFYGPKIDVQMRNVGGKEDTAFTVQYDFCMPDRFDLNYTDESGSDKRAVVVHRSSIGAIERVMAFLIEHYAGAFPLWLAPEQIIIVPVSKLHHQYGETIRDELMDLGVRVKLDDSNQSVGKRVRLAKQSKVPYLVILGDKEIADKSITAVARDGTEEQFKPEDFYNRLGKEIKNKN